MIGSPRRERNKLIILLVCCASVLMVGLDVTVLNVALPSLQRDFHASIAGAQWTMDAYTIVIGSLLISSGVAADRIGRRSVFQAGLLIFTIGSLLCGFAPSLGWIIAFRVIQAIGGSMLNPVAMSIISNTFTKPDERARAIGVWGGVAGISMAAGPMLGGLLIDSIGWRAIFWINAPIGLAALVLTWLLVPESRSPIYRKPDAIGQILVIVMFSSLTFGIIEGPEIGWTNIWVVACFVCAALSLAVVLPYEARRPDPLIDLRFFSSAPFSGASLIALLGYLTFGGFLFLNTLYLQDVRGYSALRAGLFILPMAAAMAIFSPVAGYAVAKYGARAPLAGGALAMLAAMLMFAASSPALPLVQLLAGFVLTGLGLGAANAALTNTAISGMPRSQAGLAAAVLSTMRQVGQSLGVAAIGSIIATYSHPIRIGPDFNRAWFLSWWVLTFCAIVVVATAFATTGDWGRRTAARASDLIHSEAQREGSVRIGKPIASESGRGERQQAFD